MLADREKIYLDRSAKINHFQTTRHALLVFHVGVVGVLAKELIQDNSQHWLHNDLQAGVWILLVIILLACLTAIEWNLFDRVVSLSKKSMLLECQLGISSDEALRYYSGRGPGLKRNFFILLGVMPELVTAGYFLLLGLIFCGKHLCLLSFWSFLGTLFFAVLCMYHVVKIDNELSEKDILEGKERKVYESTGSHKKISVISNKGFRFGRNRRIKLRRRIV